MKHQIDQLKGQIKEERSKQKI